MRLSSIGLAFLSLPLTSTMNDYLGIINIFLYCIDLAAISLSQLCHVGQKLTLGRIIKSPNIWDPESKARRSFLWRRRAGTMYHLGGILPAASHAFSKVYGVDISGWCGSLIFLREQAVRCINLSGYQCFDNVSRCWLLLTVSAQKFQDIKGPVIPQDLKSLALVASCLLLLFIFITKCCAEGLLRIYVIYDDSPKDVVICSTYIQYV